MQKDEYEPHMPNALVLFLAILDRSIDVADGPWALGDGYPRPRPGQLGVIHVAV